MVSRHEVALIGIGMMGERMGGRLLDAGHELTVYNRTRGRTAALEARGAAIAGTPRCRRRRRVSDHDAV